MKKKILFTSLSIILLGGLLTGLGVTMASFSTKANVGQAVQTNGKIGKFIYLNPNIWEVDNPDYYIYYWNPSNVNDNGWLTPSKKTNKGYILFVIENYATYSSFKFVRYNPTYTPGDASTWNNDHRWNATVNQTIAGMSTNNLYTINTWETVNDNKESSSGSWSLYSPS